MKNIFHKKKNETEDEDDDYGWLNKGIDFDEENYDS